MGDCSAPGCQTQSSLLAAAHTQVNSCTVSHFLPRRFQAIEALEVTNGPQQLLRSERAVKLKCTCKIKACLVAGASCPAGALAGHRLAAARAKRSPRAQQPATCRAGGAAAASMSWQASTHAARTCALPGGATTPQCALLTYTRTACRQLRQQQSCSCGVGQHMGVPECTAHHSTSSVDPQPSDRRRRPSAGQCCKYDNSVCRQLQRRAEHWAYLQPGFPGRPACPARWMVRSSAW